MKRTIVRAALATFLIATLGASYAAATEAGTFDAALARAAAEGKPLVIDFYTDW